MVHYVTVKRTVPIRHIYEKPVITCQVCRDSGLAYHRTQPHSFREIADDSLMRPDRCRAKVLSFSRDRTQRQGGPVNLVFRERDLPGKKEMCYPLTRGESERYDKIREILRELRRKGHQGDWESIDEQTVIVDAKTAITAREYRGECEVMSRGCVPVRRALKVEYWISGGRQINCGYRIAKPDSGILKLIARSAVDGLMRDIDSTRETARRLKRPFECKSCFRAIVWPLDDYDREFAWSPLTPETFRIFENGQWPEAAGKFVNHRSIPEKYRHCRCRPDRPIL